MVEKTGILSLLDAKSCEPCSDTFGNGIAMRFSQLETKALQEACKLFKIGQTRGGP